MKHFFLLSILFLSLTSVVHASGSIDISSPGDDAPAAPPGAKMLIDLALKYTEPESYTTHDYGCWSLDWYDAVSKEWAKHNPSDYHGTLYSFFENDNKSYADSKVNFSVSTPKAHDKFRDYTSMVGSQRFDTDRECEDKINELEAPKPPDVCIVFDFGLTRPSDSALDPNDNNALNTLVCSRPFLCRTLPPQFESVCQDKVARMLNGHYGVQTELTLDPSDSLYQKLQNCIQYNPGYGTPIAFSNCMSITDPDINDPREWNEHGGNGAPLLGEPPF